MSDYMTVKKEIKAGYTSNRSLLFLMPMIITMHLVSSIRLLMVGRWYLVLLVLILSVGIAWTLVSNLKAYRYYKEKGRKWGIL